VTDGRFAVAFSGAIREGLKLVPGVAVLEAALKPLIRDNDGAFRLALEQELLEDVLECQTRINRLEETLKTHGQALEDLRANHRARLLEDLADGMRTVQSPTKRDAILNAVAHQFDPTAGKPGTRKYLLELVHSLSDAEVEALSLTARQGWLLFGNQDWGFRMPSVRWTRNLKTNDTGTAIDMGVDDVSTLRQVLGELSQKVPQLIDASRNGTDRKSPPNMFVLTPMGEAVARIIRPIEGDQPEAAAGNAS